MLEKLARFKAEYVRREPYFLTIYSRLTWLYHLAGFLFACSGLTDEELAKALKQSDELMDIKPESVN